MALNCSMLQVPAHCRSSHPNSRHDLIQGTSNCGYCEYLISAGARTGCPTLDKYLQRWDIVWEIAEWNQGHVLEGTCHKSTVCRGIEGGYQLSECIVRKRREPPARRSQPRPLLIQSKSVEHMLALQSRIRPSGATRQALQAHRGLAGGRMGRRLRSPVTVGNLDFPCFIKANYNLPRQSVQVGYPQRAQELWTS